MTPRPPSHSRFAALLLMLLSLSLTADLTRANERPATPQASAPNSAAPYQVWPLTADANAEDFSDLAPLGQALAGAQVVGLAEQTHGAHEEFAYKLRLLRYLHEELGFEVLQLESGFYDLGRISQAMARGEKLDDLASGNVFFMYSKSAEGRRMLQYVDQTQQSANPLKLAGTDSQHSGELSGKTLLPGLQAALTKAGHPDLVQGEPWRQMSRLSSALLALQRQAPMADEQTAFFTQTKRMRAALCGPKAAGGAAAPLLDGPAWWCRVVLSLEAQARSYWSQDADYQRDNVMGANSIWLTEQMFQGRKTVIWAHIVHLARGFQRSPTHLQAGEVMHRHWGGRYQVIHFSAGGGQILDFGSMQAQTLPTPAAGSLEAQLMAGKPMQPLLLHAARPLEMPQYAFEYLQQGAETSLREGQLGRNWDWLVFFPSVRPVSMVR
ncbi:erythromycin esterase family protein [Paucibacter sp. AS339]|uniref:erythromycin esterase family protein n=1 Tax=Paucibacter hankyongi TaxID=3133434 RepID=UPI0030A57B0E